MGLITASLTSLGLDTYENYLTSTTTLMEEQSFFNNSDDGLLMLRWIEALGLARKPLIRLASVCGYRAITLTTPTPTTLITTVYNTVQSWAVNVATDTDVTDLRDDIEALIDPADATDVSDSVRAEYWALNFALWCINGAVQTGLDPGEVDDWHDNAVYELSMCGTRMMVNYNGAAATSLSVRTSNLAQSEQVRQNIAWADIEALL